MPALEPPVVSTSSVADKCRGVAFSLTMVFSAFFGSVYVLIPLMPLMLLSPRVFRRIVDRLISFWLMMPMGLINYMFGVRVCVSGDVIENDRPALILMNHRTRLDWLFFWSALFRIDPWLLTTEKISLKAILKYVPGAGWAMATNAFVFLDRIFAKDKPRINTLIDYYARTGGKYQLLLFPEGTDKCPIATARSHSFAEKNNLTQYDYVLHPRTTGFAYILQKMRDASYADYVYDVTVAYSDRIIQTEYDLVLLGLTPKEVHFDIRKIAVKDLPATERELEVWLKEHWALKEERLRDFYAGVRANPKHRLDTLPGATTDFECTNWTRILEKIAVLFWSLMTLSWIYFFLTYPYQLHFAILATAYFVSAQYFCGGVEILMARQSEKAIDVFSTSSKVEKTDENANSVGNGAEVQNFLRVEGK